MSLSFHSGRAGVLCPTVPIVFYLNRMQLIVLHYERTTHKLGQISAGVYTWAERMVSIGVHTQ